ncbi:MAG TPA: dethiobiotin synthase [Bryobacteraceae bacterium]|nr:dethiobiotin synthase [Bryobacteraceae bacterium]
MRGVFVTGTDTGVGKTVLSAALMLRYPDATYWKPIQTGPDDDTSEVGRLSGGRVCAEGIRHPDPVSPHLSRTRIDLDALVRRTFGTAVVIEGAGGVLVPVNESQTMADFMVKLGLPVMVATRTTLGTINHTVLTIEALRARSLKIAGVVMIGDRNSDNRAAIERYGKVSVLAEMPRFDPLTPECLRSWAETLPKDLIP